MNLHLAPGSIVNKKLVYDQLGISPAFLHKAILRLQVESQVAVFPNSGTYVPRMNLQSVLDGPWGMMHWN